VPSDLIPPGSGGTKYVKVVLCGAHTVILPRVSSLVIRVTCRYAIKTDPAAELSETSCMPRDIQIFR
jgi:hypothetical protein